MDHPTPRLAQLCFRLAIDLADIHHQIESITKRLGVDTEDCLVLNKAKDNIIDRKKEKEHHKKSWKVEIKEILHNSIQYDKELD